VPTGGIPQLHHGVAYTCTPNENAKVEALESLGPFDRKKMMLCEQFYMVCADEPQLCSSMMLYNYTISSYTILNMHYSASMAEHQRLQQCMPSSTCGTHLYVLALMLLWCDAHLLSMPGTLQLLTPNQSAHILPPAAGIPMGTPSTKYVALELHYHNPELVAGIKDPGAGIRVYYTDKLRPQDMGLITLNQPVLFIPPGVANFPTNVSVCPSSCTKR
jgi:hypothetical protein